ncbi:2-oxoacid:ferredoxin oxidoreductase subunit beta [bacterium]|nr:2-oxoacid:ferredoxin oxidoreductase subunit beta [bacterium]
MVVETRHKRAQSAEKGFRSGKDPIWCSGCGDFDVLDALAASLDGMGLKTADVAAVSGIGCSSRLPGYLGCYGFNAIHGRPLPVATGLKLARPDITVVVVTGDGDAFSIGGGHLMPAVRRDIDITFIVMDNGTYGLTKGQPSPTTPVDFKNKVKAPGARERPLNPLEIMLTYGCGFVAQCFSTQVEQMRSIFTEAVQYPGFSFVNVISPCPTFRGGMGIYKEIKRMCNVLTAEEHDAQDWDAAHKLSRNVERMHLGVLYREPREQQAEEERDAGQGGQDLQAQLQTLANTYF